MFKNKNILYIIFVFLILVLAVSCKSVSKPRYVFNQIVFVSDRSGIKQLYSMTAEGKNQRPIKGFKGETWFPSFSPDAKNLSFFSYIKPRQVDLHLIKANGQLINLTNTPNQDEKYANFSPDSKQIAFTALINNKAEAVKMNLDRSGYKVLTSGVNPDTNPIFSPDGKTIFWNAQIWEKPITRIARMDLDGGNKKILVNNNTEDGVDSISPDGKWLAGSGIRDGHWDALVYSSDEKKQIRVTKDIDFDTRVFWQPNGNKIVWQHRVDNQQFDIYIAEFPTLKVKNITNAKGDDIGAVWTQDGRLVFTSDRDGDFEIYIMNSDGSGLKQLTHNTFEDSMPAWKPQKKGAVTDDK